MLDSKSPLLGCGVLFETPVVTNLSNELLSSKETGQQSPSDTKRSETWVIESVALTLDGIHILSESCLSRKPKAYSLPSKAFRSKRERHPIVDQ